MPSTAAASAAASPRSGEAASGISGAAGGRRRAPCRHRSSWAAACSPRSRCSEPPVLMARPLAQPCRRPAAAPSWRRSEAARVVGLVTGIGRWCRSGWRWRPPKQARSLVSPRHYPPASPWREAGSPRSSQPERKATTAARGAARFAGPRAPASPPPTGSRGSLARVIAGSKSIHRCGGLGRRRWLRSGARNPLGREPHRRCPQPCRPG